MTGRAAGFCAGFPLPGFANRFGGRGFRGRGCGRGGGRGWRNGFRATGLTGWQRAAMGAAPVPWGAPPAAPTREQEVEQLQGQARDLEAALGNVRKRIEELSGQTPKDK